MSLAKRFSRSQSQSHEGRTYLSKIRSKIALASNFLGFSQTEDLWWNLCDLLSMDLQGPRPPGSFFSLTSPQSCGAKEEELRV